MDEDRGTGALAGCRVGEIEALLGQGIVAESWSDLYLPD